MTNKELALVLLQTVEQFDELPLQIVYEDVRGGIAYESKISKETGSHPY